MQSLRKMAAVALYLALLLVLMYGATLLVFILAVWLPSSSLLLFLVAILTGTASSYLFFHLTQRFPWTLPHAALRKIAAVVFAVLGLLFSVVTALLALLMQRSGEYWPGHIAQAVAPPLVWMALCMGIILAYRLMHHRLLQSSLRADRTL